MLTYLQLNRDDPAHLTMAAALWLPFIRELNAHDGPIESDEHILQGLRKRVAIQGTRPDMHFEVALRDGIPVATAMFAIDLGTVYGLLPRGCGTIMGFYVEPSHRRQGLGRAFFRHIEDTLRRDGASCLYLCPESVTGVPFWRAMGFADSGLIDPDDQLPIYLKALTDHSNPTTV